MNARLQCKLPLSVLRRGRDYPRLDRRQFSRSQLTQFLPKRDGIYHLHWPAVAAVKNFTGSYQPVALQTGFADHDKRFHCQVRIAPRLAR
jgi:hypothetical protein